MTNSTFRSDNIGISLVICGAILFSAKGILIKLVYDDGLSTIAVIALRMMFSLPVFVVVAWLAYKKTKPILTPKTLWWTTICGILSYYLAAWLSFYGLHYITVQLERLILFSYPTLVVIGVAIMTKSLPSKRVCLAAAATYAGIICVFGYDFHVSAQDVTNSQSSQIILGSSLVALSAVSFAIYVIASKPLITLMGSALFTGLSMTVSSLAVLIHVGISFLIYGAGSGFQAGSLSYFYVFIIGLFGTVIPALMLNEAVARIGPERTAILGTTGPIATSALAVAILGEAFTVFHVIGLAFSIAGISLILGIKGRAKKSSA